LAAIKADYDKKYAAIAARRKVPQDKIMVFLPKILESVSGVRKYLGSLGLGPQQDKAIP
jgi:hypothetical protein